MGDVRETSNLVDILESIVGYSESESIQDFPSQGISVDQELEKVFEGFPEVDFVPERIIFFDAVVRLDYVLLTSKSVVGFITFCLGHIDSSFSEPIDLNRDVGFEVVRKLVISRYDIKSEGAYDRFRLSDRYDLAYDIQVVDGIYPRIADLWDNYILKDLLPELERKYVSDKILRGLRDSDILIKDGLIGEFGDNINVFGHVKTFNLSPVVLNDSSLKENFVSGIYKNGEYFSCYLDLSKGRRSFRSGIFGYSRLDVKCEKLNEEVLKRFRFVTKYFQDLTSVFSDSSRFPQNLPIIETLEKFLRSKSGDRNIISLIIRKHLGGLGRSL